MYLVVIPRSFVFYEAKEWSNGSEELGRGWLEGVGRWEAVVGGTVWEKNKLKKIRNEKQKKSIHCVKTYSK